VGFHLDHPASRPASTAFGPEADTGDVDAELATAAMVVDERYHTPEECHSAVEPHAATAWWGLRRQGAVWSAGDPRRDGR
jgi:xanthine dehydrogenase YagR molybdenum-binding subunit